MSFSNYFQTLELAAEAYFHLGWSVIPLLGDLDPSRPKVPAIPWSGFQQYRASTDEHHQWFTEKGFAGLGIVTGHISHLVVLDFDAHNIMGAFKARFPDLLETRTVISAGRGLPHLYFHLPDHLHLSSIKGQGVDLLSDGRFVVAPPTAINEHVYKITRGGMPRTLTIHDIGRLQAFVATYTTDHTKTRSISPIKPSSPVLTSPTSVKASSKDLSSLYRYYCQRGSRNEALFRASLYARDTGWQPIETQQCLVPLHIQQSQHHETPAQREREALRTINSAFSRPARLITIKAPRNSLQLSNSVREKLMQQKMTYVIRTYEGLLHAGVRPGQVITAKEAVNRLKGLIGRDSVLNALKAQYNDQPLFTKAPPVSPPYTVATNHALNESKKCSFVGRNLQYKPQGGRPQHLFMMPTNEELCGILGVKVTGSDPVERTDLASAPKTRMALHRELIKRRPGQYPCGWLARRLGVNKRTIFTYNRLIPIHSQAMFTETPINWNTIERLPFDEATPGAVLVTQAGKRYPALRTIASRLLARGEGICLKQQTANFYWYGEAEPVFTRLQYQQEAVIKQERCDQFMTKFHNIMETLPPATKPVKPRSKPQLLSNLHRPLKDGAHEAQAQHLYEMMNQLSAKRLSLANARRLVATYNAEAITSVLRLLTNRQNLSNPIGFFVTSLRSAQRYSE